MYVYLAASCLLLINLTCTFFFKSIHDTHVEHCIYLPAQKKIRTNINGNMPALQHTITCESNPKTVQLKKGCSPQEGHCEKRCKIQGGGQEMAVMVG